MDLITLADPWGGPKAISATAQDFASCLQDPVDVHFPEAAVSSHVLDNLCIPFKVPLNAPRYKSAPACRGRYCRQGRHGRLYCVGAPLPRV
jgi:hypothetical protein